MSGNNVQRSRNPFQDYVIANPSLTPVSYKDASDATGGGIAPMSASELVDKSFVIYHAKPFNSTFEGGGVAYFCKIRVEGEEEIKSVVIGGKVCVDFLHTYARAGFANPLLVTLRLTQKDESKDPYYIFE